MGLTVDKIATFLTYWMSVVLAFFGSQTPERLALYVGMGCAIFTALVNFWYQHKRYRYLISPGDGEGKSRGLDR
ncbi:phage holin family protein [Pseudocitrobacter cyperus]|uniref:Primosomal protein n=1 Tax=Pseudocitrobacter cyperus TaxID=3112843 RepID=A0ABV0HJT3_9ENTR